jgi:hypothetical protein
LFNNHLVLCVNGDLNIVADADLGVSSHGAAIRIGQ